MFISVALSHPPLTSVLTTRILIRQYSVVDLLTRTTYNTD